MLLKADTKYCIEVSLKVIVSMKADMCGLQCSKGEETERDGVWKEGSKGDRSSHIVTLGRVIVQNATCFCSGTFHTLTSLNVCFSLCMNLRIPHWVTVTTCLSLLPCEQLSCLRRVSQSSGSWHGFSKLLNFPLTFFREQSQQSRLKAKTIGGTGKNGRTYPAL